MSMIPLLCCENCRTFSTRDECIACVAQNEANRYKFELQRAQKDIKVLLEQRTACHQEIDRLKKEAEANKKNIDPISYCHQYGLCKNFKNNNLFFGGCDICPAIKNDMEKL